MYHTINHIREERINRRNSFYPVLRRILRAAWNMFVSVVINLRDCSGAGRIQL